MEDFIKIIDTVKEFTKDVHIDYDRNTILMFLGDKYLQDFLVKLDKTPYEILFKLPIEGKLICILIGYDYSLTDMIEFDED